MFVWRASCDVAALCCCVVASLSLSFVVRCDVALRSGGHCLCLYLFLRSVVPWYAFAIVVAMALQVMCVCVRLWRCVDVMMWSDDLWGRLMPCEM